MKKVVIFLLVVAISFPNFSEAKIWRVNNNPGVVADFATLDAAMATYAAGDSIHLEPSGTTYFLSSNEFNTSGKFVTIIGNGYDLNINTGLQQNHLSSVINGYNSADLVVVKDIKFIGIKFNSVLMNGNSSGDVNISFESCLFTTGFMYTGNVSLPISNIHFKKNFFNGFLFQMFNLSATSVLSNYTFENNIVRDLYYQDSFWDEDVSRRIVRNNVFVNGYHGQGNYVANNIFKNGADLMINCIVKNNIFNTPAVTFPEALASFNNVFGVDMSTVFQSPLTDIDNCFLLKPGCQAIGAGVPNGATSVDCGAFGGPNPYKLSGIPAIPAIYELQVPTLINSGNNMQINMKSRSNN